MVDKFTIQNEDLASNLIAMALLCAENKTDNCDLTLTTNKGKIKCHIEFEVEKEEPDNE